LQWSGHEPLASIGTDAKLDSRLASGFYAVMPNPADGSVWGSVAFRYPGALLRFDTAGGAFQLRPTPLAH
jgi:hypothetical protein